MPSLTVRAGQFWLGDQPVLIQAGEFHYFRTPAEQWAHRLGLLKAAGFNTVASYIPWLWHETEAGRTDLDGHSHPLRNLAGFLDLAAEMGLYVIARPGPYIMAETINEGIPPWVFRQFPQAAFISQANTAQNLASYLHPDFRACVTAWYRAVFQVLAPRQITRGGTILMVQLDNEMGMLQWLRNIVDLNPDTLARFAAYQPAAEAGQPGPRSVDALRAGLVDPAAPQAGQVMADYRRFYREYLREYTVFLRAEAEANGLEVPAVINIHGFGNGGKTFPIGLSQLVRVMELDGLLSATDVYPLAIGEGNFHQLLMVNEMTKALQNPEQALFSAEFQAGGNPDFGGGQTSFYDLHTRLCLSSGMRAINHYLFCDGENDPVLSPVRRHDWGHPVRKDGSLRAHYARYPKLSRVLQAYGADLTLVRPRAVTAIGFLLDYFMTEVNSAATEAATRVLTHQRETILFDFLARGLALTHRPFTTLELTRAALDVRATPVLWVMLERQCPAEVQQKLVDYARQGGQLIIVGRLSGEAFDQAPCTLLQTALGVTAVQSDAPFTAGRFRAFGYAEVPASFLESYSGTFDEVFAERGAGEVVGFIQRLGAGRVMVLGAALAANTLEDLDIVHQMALKMGCPPLLTASPWVDARLSTGERGSFMYLNNYQDDPVETTLTLEGRPLFGGQAVRLPARRGLILPLDWHCRPGVLIHSLTAEVTAIVETETGLQLRTEPAEFRAELTLEGYRCGPAGGPRLRLHGTDGLIELERV